MKLSEVEELRAQGWYFTFTGDPDGWMCTVTGKGLAHGQGSGKTLEESADWAMRTARTMEDDPEVVIKKYGAQIEKIANEVFGPGVYQGLEAVHWEPCEPARIALNVAPKVTPKAYVDLEVKMIHRMIDELPREVSIAVVFEVDWQDEREGKK